MTDINGNDNFCFRALIPRLSSLLDLVEFSLCRSRESYARPSMYGLIPSGYRAFLGAQLLCLERCVKNAMPDYPLDLLGEFSAVAFRDFDDIIGKHRELLTRFEDVCPSSNLPPIAAERLPDVLLNALREAYAHPEWYIAPASMKQDRAEYLPNLPFHLFCEDILEMWDALHDNFAEYAGWSMNFVFLPFGNSRDERLSFADPVLTLTENFAAVIASIENRIAGISAYYAWRRQRWKPILISGTWQAKSEFSYWNCAELSFSEKAEVTLTCGKNRHESDSLSGSYIFTDDTSIRTSLFLNEDGRRVMLLHSEGMQLILQHSPRCISLHALHGQIIKFYPEAKP